MTFLCVEGMNLASGFRLTASANRFNSSSTTSGATKASSGAGNREPEGGSHFDSRTFPAESPGIRLGSSQNVNVVLFSLACR
jgi:hypothetical protein